MSTITPAVARQALRIASRRYPSSAFSRPSPAVRGRRSYASETKPYNASVNVDTAIKADQKAFIGQTGRRPEDVKVPTTGIEGSAMLSPTAGNSRLGLLFATPPYR